jgi:hypothetical protein
MRFCFRRLNNSTDILRTLLDELARAEVDINNIVHLRPLDRGR